MLGGAIVGVVFLVLYGVMAWHMSVRQANAPPEVLFITAWVCPGGLLLGLAGLTFAGVAKLWRTRNTPLVAGASLGATYGRRELVAAGASRCVRLERHSRWVTPEDGPSYEEHVAHVYIERLDGTFAELPRPYFSDLEGWELGEALAKDVATALGVPFLDEAPPAHSSTPRRRERCIWLGCFGPAMVLAGLPIYLMGVALVWSGRLDGAAWVKGLVPGAFIVGGGAFITLGWVRGFGGRLRGAALLLAVLAGLVGGVRIWLD